MQSLSSRERILEALSCRKPDHVPSCFHAFRDLRKVCENDFEFYQKQLDLGLDVRVELPDLPIGPGPDVSVRCRKEAPKEPGAPSLLHKEYQTPSGTLKAIVRQVQDWPYGDQVPLMDDYLACRSEKFLVTEPADLPALRHLLAPPSDQAIADFRQMAKQYKEFAKKNDLLFSGGYRTYRRDNIPVSGADCSTFGIDGMMWLCGSTAPLFWTSDEPAFLEELIDTIAQFTRRRMEIFLDLGVEVLFKRAWYEGTSFWSPDLYAKLIAPVLRKDVALAHQAGAKFAYIQDSGTMPILDQLIDLGIDALVGFDPVEGVGTNLAELARRVDGKICLWGGVCGPLEVENKTYQEIHQAVANAIKICGQTGGYITSPVALRADSEKTWQNIRDFIKAWQELGKV